MRRLIFRLLTCCLLCAPLRLFAQQAPQPQQPQAAPQPSAPPHSRVYYGSSPELMEGFSANPEAVSNMTDQLVMAATGQKTIAGAWRTLVAPSDRIGIKISAAGGREFSTHASIVQAVLRGLAQAGIPMSHVVIWDRTDPQDAGYVPVDGGPSIRHIEPFTGYDPKAVVTLPSVGRLIWGDIAFNPRGANPLAPIELEQYSVDSHWSRLICGLNKIINIPVMASSEDCGLGGCLYNLTIPNLDNWRRFVTPPGFGDPFLADLYSDEHAGPKVVLSIMDGLIAQYGGGPEWHPAYSYSYGTLFAGKDPVAIDATALRVLNGWRTKASLPSLIERARYLQSADEMGLGNYLEGQIDLVNVQP